MSRYEVPTMQLDWEYVVGWDPPLGTFFGQVYYRNGMKLIKWIGTSIEEITSVEDLTNRLSGSVVISPELQQQLRADQQETGFRPNFGTAILRTLTAVATHQKQ